MLDTWFFVFIAATGIFLGIGFWKKSAPLFGIGALFLLTSGLTMVGEGIWVPTTYSFDANATLADTNYTVYLGGVCPDAKIEPSVAHCRTDLALVVLGNVSVYLGFGAILGSLFLIVQWAFRKKRGEY